LVLLVPQLKSLCSQLKTMLEYPCSQNVMGVFSNPKGPVFWNSGESSARAIQLKVEGEPLPRKTPQFFLQETPTHAIRSKAEEELSSLHLNDLL